MSLQAALYEAQKEAVRSWMKKIEFYTIRRDALQNHDTIAKCYNKDMINRDFIEATFEVAVIKQARRDYKLLITKHTNIDYADSVEYPECLVYALKKGLFTKKQIKKIPFDGQNVETFTQQYEKKNLLSELREEFLHPTPMIKLEER